MLPRACFWDTKGSVITLVYKGSLWYVFFLTFVFEQQWAGVLVIDATAIFSSKRLPKQALGSNLCLRSTVVGILCTFPLVGFHNNVYSFVSCIETNHGTTLQLAVSLYEPCTSQVRSTVLNFVQSLLKKHCCRHPLHISSRRVPQQRLFIRIMHWNQPWNHSTTRGFPVRAMYQSSQPHLLHLSLQVQVLGILRLSEIVYDWSPIISSGDVNDLTRSLPRSCTWVFFK
jgi:hypothetical protein